MVQSNLRHEMAPGASPATLVVPTMWLPAQLGPLAQYWTVALVGKATVPIFFTRAQSLAFPGVVAPETGQSCKI